MKKVYLNFHDVIALALIVGFGAIFSFIVGIFLLAKKQDDSN